MKLIVTADWHLREDKPRCRIDEDWMEMQRKVIEFVYEQAIQNKAIIIIAGDIFNKARVIQEIEIMLIEWAKKVYRDTGNYVYIIAGNHCLLFHNYENINKGSIGVILSSGYFKLLSKIPTKKEDLNIYGVSYGKQ